MKKFTASLVLAIVLVATGLVSVGCDNLDPLKSEGISREALKAVTDGNDANCNDNNACTTDGVDANSKLCVHTDVDCNDNNVCTTDSCDPAIGCVFTAVVGCCLTDANCNAGQVCEDNLCVVEDLCAGVVCDDANVCTVDSCNPQTGVCVYVNNTVACDDGLFCTVNDVCVDGFCKGTWGVKCFDNVTCTTDVCDEDGDVCIFNPLDTLCDDTNLCTTDFCDPVTGCVHDPVPGCVWCQVNTDCTDGNACNGLEICGQDNVCTAGILLICDDSDPCTTDSCDSVSGCVFTAIVGCCTTDVQCFDVGETSWGYSAPCELDEDCLEPGHVCVEGTMCLPEAYDYGCSTFDDVDGNPDNLPGTCEMCADSNGDDFCSSTETFCDGGLDEDADGLVDCEDDDCDGQACGAGFICDDGTCVENDCDDGNVCTNDTLVVGGCHHTFNNITCDDGDACTTDDECKIGICTGGPELDCDDGSVCTTDSCDPVDGCMYEDILECCLTDVDCEDGEVCTAGVCESAPTEPCGASNCLAGNHCEGGFCVVDGFAIWCWDHTLPSEGVPHCHTFTGPAGTYWSPPVWSFKDYAVVPPRCGSAPAGVIPPPIQYPYPVCCVSGAGALGLCEGGATFHPYL